MRANLARAASTFARGLPALVFLTDDERTPEPLASVERLPCASLVIVRARAAARRAELVRAIAPLARRRRLFWTVAADPELASRSGADGIHFPELMLDLAAKWRVRRPDWLITAAAHSLAACLRAKRSGADAVLLAPVFGTASHRDRQGLGAARVGHIVRQVPLPIYALGGIEAVSARRLLGLPLAGLAAVGALTA